MASIGWLHLSDLHHGLPGQRWLWPGVREQFFDDLARLHDRAGPWDVVLFTGDLTQRGTAEEFAQLQATLDKLWRHLESLGSRPSLVAVPGNHDLVRPDARRAAVRALRQWHDDPELRGEFWSSANCEYRELVRGAFAPYEAFSSYKAPAGLRRGMLPGDVSVTIEREGISLGVAGLNSAFLQLSGDDFQGRLELTPQQLAGVCDEGDYADWASRHHAALLLTHHPASWLHPRALESFRAEIAPPGRFTAHLFGHMHEGTTTSLTISGAAPLRSVQGPSLFGLESWGDGSARRVHGFLAMRLTINGNDAALRTWPRELRKTRAGAWQMAADTNFHLDNETVVETFSVRRPVEAPAAVSAPPPVAGQRAPMPAPMPAATATATTGPRVAISGLSGPQLAEFHRALLASFPDASALAEMVLFQLGENLAHIASDGNLRKATFELLTWAQSRGRLGDLLVGALNANPINPELRRLAAQYNIALGPVVGGAYTAPVTVTAQSPRVVQGAPGSPAFSRELRATLTSLYTSTLDILRVCADAGLDRGRIDLNGNPATVWFNVLEEARKVGRLSRIVDLALEDYPDHTDLQRYRRELGAREGKEAASTLRNTLLDDLAQLLTAQFEEVVFRLSISPHQLPPSTVPQGERAIALIRLLEPKNQLGDLRNVIELVRGGRR